MPNTYTPSPIREQTQFLDELTALRVEYEKNMKRLYARQSDYKAAWRIVWQLIDAGAPSDLNIVVSYDYYTDDRLCFYCFGQTSQEPGNLLEALDRTHLIDECLVRPSENFKNMWDVVFANYPLLKMYCPRRDIAALQVAA